MVFQREPSLLLGFALVQKSQLQKAEEESMIAAGATGTPCQALTHGQSKLGTRALYQASVVPSIIGLCILMPLSLLGTGGSGEGEPCKRETSVASGLSRFLGTLFVDCFQVASRDR